MARQCELCELPARMHCESDQASLCWECDARVHGANFLVARHSRRLLCRSCQAPTPWRASGPWLGPTVSLCEHCQGAGDGSGCEGMEKGERESGGDLERHGEEEGEEEEEEEEDEDSGDEEGEEEGENQVVPLSMEAVTPPPVASCSNSDETSSGRTAVCAFPPKLSVNSSLSLSRVLGMLFHWTCSSTLSLSPSLSIGPTRSATLHNAATTVPPRRARRQHTLRDGGRRNPGKRPRPAVTRFGPSMTRLPELATGVDRIMILMPRGRSQTVDVMMPSFCSPPIQVFPFSAFRNHLGVRF